MRENIIRCLILFVCFINIFQSSNAQDIGHKINTNSSLITVYYPPNSSQNLLDHLKAYDASYMEVYVNTIATLTDLDTKILSFNSEKGHINARISGDKEVFIIILPVNQKLTYIRVTPANGEYDLSQKFLSNFFTKIQSKLKKQ